MCRLSRMFLHLSVFVLYANAPHAEVTSATAAVDPEALSVLKEMCDAAAAMKSFRLTTDQTIELMHDSGQMIQLSVAASLSVRRPDRAYARRVGDLGTRSLTYDGQTVFLLFENENAYSRALVPGELGDAVDFLAQKLGVIVPMGDLLVDDPFGAVTSRIQSGVYVGQHQVGKFSCHHLAFRQENVDWQVWVDALGEPLLRKLVITYKNRPGYPRFTARVVSWEVEPDFPDHTFKFTPPEGAEEIEFLTLEGDVFRHDAQ